jgi:CRISPR-associated protein Cas2
MIDILVCYDVSTEDNAGKRRLRHVANACKSYGQRVQKSVFECRVSPAQYETFKAKLTKIIRKDTDSLRLYRLRTPREDHLDVLGIDTYVDFDEPLIL